MRPLARACALLTCALGVGCASMQKERGHEDVARIVAASTGHHTGWDRGTPEAKQIADRVRMLLKNGLTRDAAVEIALVNNPELQATYDELDVSQADLVEAGLLSNPSVGGSIGFRMNGSGRPEYEVSIAESFLDLFLLPLRKRVAEAEFQAETLRVAHAVLETVAKTERALAAYQATEQTVELMRSLAQGADAAATLANAQFEAGNVTQRTQASERASSVEASLELARDELELTEEREKLNRLLGLWGPEISWQLAEKLPPVPAVAPPLEHLELTALRQRLDVAAARKQFELMDAALGLAKTSRYTGLVNVGAHMHQDVTGPLLFGPTLSLELPIFNQRQGLIGRLEAERRRAQRQLDAVGLDVRSEVRIASARLELARKAAAEYGATLLPLRREIFAQAELEYNAMQIGLYELLAVKKAELEASRAYLESVRDYWMAHAELERALGGRIPAAPETNLHPAE